MVFSFPNSNTTRALHVKDHVASTSYQIIIRKANVNLIQKTTVLLASALALHTRDVEDRCYRAAVKLRLLNRFHHFLTNGEPVQCGSASASVSFTKAPGHTLFFLSCFSHCSEVPLRPRALILRTYIPSRSPLQEHRVWHPICSRP